MVVILGRDDHRHPIMDHPYKVIGVRCDDRKRPDPFIGARPLPVLPDASQGKWLSARHANRIGLLRFQPFDRFPLEEVINGNETTTALVGIAEGWK